MTVYADIEELKDRLDITTQNFEAQVAAALNAASRAVEHYCDRIFYQTSSQARTFEACHLYKLKLGAYNDLVSVTSLKTDAAGDGTFETTWSASDYQLLPSNPSSAPEQRPYTSVKAVASRTFPVPYTQFGRADRVEITGVWGWPAVPDAVEQATLILASELYRLKDAPFGIADFGEAGLIRLRENPRYAALLGPYRRHPVLVA
jgi:hypothetical protein